MSFHAQTTHPESTLAFNGKTIHGQGPTQVTRAEATHLRANYPNVIVAEVEGGPDEPEAQPVPEAQDERRQHELRQRRGEYAPTFDHGHPDDPESDLYRERRKRQHTPARPTAEALTDLTGQEETPHRGSAASARELDAPHSLQTDPSVKGLIDQKSQDKKNPSGHR